MLAQEAVAGRAPADERIRHLATVGLRDTAAQLHAGTVLDARLERAAVRAVGGGEHGACDEQPTNDPSGTLALLLRRRVGGEPGAIGRREIVTGVIDPVVEAARPKRVEAAV